jgi:hypothetical protein
MVATACLKKPGDFGLADLEKAAPAGWAGDMLPPHLAGVAAFRHSCELSLPTRSS